MHTVELNSRLRLVLRFSTSFPAVVQPLRIKNRKSIGLIVSGDERATADDIGNHSFQVEKQKTCHARKLICSASGTFPQVFLFFRFC